MQDATPHRIAGEDLRQGHSRLGLTHLQRFARRPLPFLQDVRARGGDVAEFTMLGTPWILLSHPDDIADLFSRREEELGRDSYMHVLKRALGEGLLTSEGELWRRQRKLASVAFTPKRIKGYAPRMAAVTEAGLGRWSSGASIDLHAEMSHLTMEVVADVLFGTGVTPADVRTVRESLEVFNDFFAQSPEALFRLPKWLPTPRNRRMSRAVAEVDALVYRIIEARRRSGEERDDLLGALLSAKEDDGTGMDDRQLRDEVVTLFLAGHETTALALVHALYLLARHPEHEARVLRELGDVLGGRLPTAGDVPALALTERVVKEAMRLYPPAWLTGREAKRDLEIAGRHVPKGAQLIVSQWLVHRDPRWYADPEVFDPERWTTERTVARPKFSYFPFGGGARICIGNHFAMMEAVLMLACILQRFHVSLLPFEEIGFAPSVTLRPERGVRVRIEARSAARTEPQIGATADAE